MIKCRQIRKAVFPDAGFETLWCLIHGSGCAIQLADKVHINPKQGQSETLGLNGNLFDCRPVGGLMRMCIYNYKKRQVN